MLNMGGPGSLTGAQDGVEAFLRRLFTDPEIIKLGPLQSVLVSSLLCVGGGGGGGGGGFRSPARLANDRRCVGHAVIGAAGVTTEPRAWRRLRRL
jgi:hypothetical protein